MDLESVLAAIKAKIAVDSDAFDVEALVGIFEEHTKKEFHAQLVAVMNEEKWEKPGASKKGDFKDFDSPAAEKLAEENSLSPDDFPQEKRTGRILQSGFRKICLADVKAKVGLGMGKFSSPGVATLAISKGLSPKDFPSLKQIKKADVEFEIRKRNL